jgi:hypothetical protein
MFATKKDAQSWLKDYGNNGYTTGKRAGSKYWWIFDRDGCVLSEEEIHSMEQA